MRWFLAPAAILLLACSSFMFTDVVEVNNSAVALYAACSERTAYTPEKPGCDPSALEDALDQSRIKAIQLIKADPKQPQGYVIYLANTERYLAMSQRALNDYSEAERIARQFFEVQKASSGQSMDDARYYWTVMTVMRLAAERQIGPVMITSARLQDMSRCIEEADLALQSMEPGIRRQLLGEYVVLLQTIALLSLDGVFDE